MPAVVRVSAKSCVMQCSDIRGQVQRKSAPPLVELQNALITGDGINGIPAKAALLLSTKSFFFFLFFFFLLFFFSIPILFYFFFFLMQH